MQRTFGKGALDQLDLLRKAGINVVELHVPSEDYLIIDPRVSGVEIYSMHELRGRIEGGRNNLGLRGDRTFRKTKARFQK